MTIRSRRFAVSRAIAMTIRALGPGQVIYSFCSDNADKEGSWERGLL
jgi:hypothetical protein